MAYAPMNLALQQTGYYQRNQQGYRMPRRSLGGQHTPAGQRVMQYGKGYDPRTAANMYGGRPPQVQTQPQWNPPQVQQNLPQWSQAQAVTRPQIAPSTYATQPWGGNQAVRRRPQQKQWGW